MKIEKLIEEWETFRRRAEGVATIVKSLPPSSDDVILKTPDSESGVVLSENTLAQIWAGDSRLALDGREGKALLMAKHRAGIRAQVVSLLCDTLTIGELALNKLHSETTENTLLSPGLMFDPSIPLVAGVAQPELGQYSVNLGDIIETTSLMAEYVEAPEEDWSTQLLRNLKSNG